MFPEAGWHEHDPSAYMKAVDSCITQVVKEFESLGYEKAMIKTVGITNQRETTVVWNKDTGRPFCNASELSPRLLTATSALTPSFTVAWPDARNAATVRKLKEKAEKTMFTTPDGKLQGEEGVQAVTGLPFR